MVRKAGNRYQIISGERRTRATKLAGISTIKAQVYENLDDKTMAEWALIENIQRVDLNPVEIARSYQQLINNHNYTHDDLAKIVGKSRSAITNALRLLKLPEQVLAWIEEGKLNGGAARALCSDKVENVEELAKRVIDEGLNVRQIEAIIRGEDINQPKGKCGYTTGRRSRDSGKNEAGTQCRHEEFREPSRDVLRYQGPAEPERFYRKQGNDCHQLLQHGRPDPHPGTHGKR